MYQGGLRDKSAGYARQGLQKQEMPGILLKGHESQEMPRKYT